MAAGDVRGGRPASLLGGAGLLLSVPVFALCGFWTGVVVLVFSGAAPAAVFYYAYEYSGRKNIFRESVHRFTFLLPVLAAAALVLFMNRFIFGLLARIPAGSSCAPVSILPVVGALLLMAAVAAAAVALALFFTYQAGSARRDK